MGHVPGHPTGCCCQYCQHREDEPSLGNWYYNEDFSAIVSVYNHMLNIVADFGKVDNHKPDALLMAQAKEMYKLLRDCRDMLRSYNVEHHFYTRGETSVYHGILRSINKVLADAQER